MSLATLHGLKVRTRQTLPIAAPTQEIRISLGGYTVRTSIAGIHELGDGSVAWFKDPDGNTFTLER